MNEQLTRLQFFQKAKEHFTEHPTGTVTKCRFPFALCTFLDDCNVSQYDRNYIIRSIGDAKRQFRTKMSKERRSKYNSAYFATDFQRMKFIDSQIKLLTK